MLIKTLVVGQLETNCYIVIEEETCKCAIIDPGAESNTILDYIEAHKLKPEVIMLSHGHFDHCTALEGIMDELEIPAYIHKAELVNDGELMGAIKYKFKDNGKMNYYAEGDVVQIGGLTFDILETPGHTDGSVTIRCENALFTGDTLFRGSCGRADLGGCAETLQKSLKRLALLEGDYEVYPGHADATTLNQERTFNPYVKAALG